MIQGVEVDGEVQEGAEEEVGGEIQGVGEEVGGQIQGVVEEVLWQWAELEEDQGQEQDEVEVKAGVGEGEEELVQGTLISTVATTCSPRAPVRLSRRSANNFKI